MLVNCLGILHACELKSNLEQMLVLINFLSHIVLKSLNANVLKKISGSVANLISSQVYWANLDFLCGPISNSDSSSLLAISVLIFIYFLLFAKFVLSKQFKRVSVKFFIKTWNREKQSDLIAWKEIPQDESMECLKSIYLKLSSRN